MHLGLFVVDQTPWKASLTQTLLCVLLCRMLPWHASGWTMFSNWHCEKSLHPKSLLALFALVKFVFSYPKKLQQFSSSLGGGDKCTFGIRILWSFYCGCTVQDLMVHGAKMRRSRCEFVAAIKGLCTDECVWTALVAVLVSRDLSLYIVYIV